MLLQIVSSIRDSRFMSQLLLRYICPHTTIYVFLECPHYYTCVQKTSHHLTVKRAFVENAEVLGLAKAELRFHSSALVRLYI